MIELLEIFSRAGGGGSSGGGAGGILIIPILIGAWIISKIVRAKKIKKAELARKQAAMLDHTWSDEHIKSRVTEIFNKFQQDWGSFNIDGMKSYLTPKYFEHMKLVMNALYQMGRQNYMQNINLKEVALLEINDHSDDELDSFDAEIIAKADDMLVQRETSEVLHQSSAGFSELWHFEKEQNVWMLDKINQVDSLKLIQTYGNTADKKYTNFADNNSYYYNADFGWLLMPLHGILFSLASFGHSDINHHVIGQHKDRVLQFFEYIPYINQKKSLKDSIQDFFYSSKKMNDARYTVGQITLPKNYGNIIIQRRGLLNALGFNYTPRNMQKMTYAPKDFGKKFNVFATDEEQVTSFELLHPVYLENLLKLKFKAHIEIVQDNLYIYSSDEKADYNTLLELLLAAYKELER